MAGTLATLEALNGTSPAQWAAKMQELCGPGLSTGDLVLWLTEYQRAVRAEARLMADIENEQAWARLATAVDREMER